MFLFDEAFSLKKFFSALLKRTTPGSKRCLPPGLRALLVYRLTSRFQQSSWVWRSQIIFRQSRKTGLFQSFSASFQQSWKKAEKKLKRRLNFCLTKFFSAKLLFSKAEKKRTCLSNYFSTKSKNEAFSQLCWKTIFFQQSWKELRQGKDVAKILEKDLLIFQQSCKQAFFQLCWKGLVNR